MRSSTCVARGFGLWVAIAACSAFAADEPGFRPLFNGSNLDGWVNVNVAPETFTVRDGLIISTGQPNGVIRTDRHYENFVLELEWRHLKPGGNAGVFIWSDALPAVGRPFTRAIEVQILDGRDTETYTSHGDVFAIQGASMKPDRPHPAGAMRCLPSEKRCKPAPEWNHYRIECRDGAIKLAVNGKEVSGGSASVPRKGYICLESEGTECHFRNIKIKELPSTSVPSEETATLGDGFVSLFSGLDFRGWKHEPGHEGHWTHSGQVIRYDGKSTGATKDLWTTKDYRNFTLVADWRFPSKPVTKPLQLILPNGDDALNSDGTKKMVDVPFAGDSGLYLRGTSKAQVNITCKTIGSGEIYGFRVDKKMPPEVRAGVTPRVKADKPPGQWNRFEITLKGDRLTILLNGQTVIEQARLLGIPEVGPIALQHHGDPIEFMNLYIKELD